MVTIKPTLRIALRPLTAHTVHHHRHETNSFSRSRSKYYVSRATGLVKTIRAKASLPKIDPINKGYLKKQIALSGVIAARHLLNIHYRILPERKIYLKEQKLTV
ncbi:hypothetical protein GCM10023092_19970 [Rurimicrobium arvi]|uniref:Uncharacterized protein n=1 Tax=Rurimicrobium arvi TaxID=2049916 RepID=A0ABP8MW02_9BACT